MPTAGTVKSSAHRGKAPGSALCFSTAWATFSNQSKHCPAAEGDARIGAACAAAPENKGCPSGNSERTRNGKTQHQRHDSGPGGRTRHSAALGHPRTGRLDRYEIRLRRRAMRRLLGAHQRCAGALLLHAGGRREGHRQDRHHRGPVGGFFAPRAEGVGDGGRAAMRLLPVGPDHGGGIAAQAEAEADRRRHRRRDDQYLSLRHLSAHPHRRASRSRQRRPVQNLKPRRSIMTKTIRGKAAKLSRRHFVVGSAAASGGLALGFHLPFGTTAALAQNAPAEVNIWVAIKPDDTVVIRIARSEMGQGTITGLAQLVAEELECDWSKVTTEPITPGRNLANKRVWGDMSTGGSRGIRTSQDYVRRAGATARTMLLQAAADEWKVPVGELTVSDSV